MRPTFLPIAACIAALAAAPYLAPAAAAPAPAAPALPAPPPPPPGVPALQNPQPNRLPPGYSAWTVPCPRPAFAVTGLDVAADGRVWCATREGEIWSWKDDKWSLFAGGLHEPCGLMLEKDGSLLVAQKPELTRILDTDRDGVADRFISVAGGAGGEFAHHHDYHEYHYGFARDDAGNIWGTLNLTNKIGLRYIDTAMSSAGGFRGWAYRLTPEGKFETVANGLRSPCGVATGPEGVPFCTDNQGDFMPTSVLYELKPGAFYGHPVSLRDAPGWDEKRVTSTSEAEYAKMRARPAVFIPYHELAKSPGNFALDATGGKFGPYAGQLVCGDQRNSNLFRIGLEKVNGHWQGFCIDFVNRLQTGVVRLSFDPQGRLWAGETGRGWEALSAPGVSSGLQFVQWDGKTVPFTIHSATVAADGFKVRFTRPLAAVPAIQVQSFWYHYWHTYGSPKVGLKTLAAEGAALSADGLECTFRCPMAKDQVYELKFPGLKDKDGQAVGADTLWYTVSELPAK